MTATTLATKLSIIDGFSNTLDKVQGGFKNASKQLGVFKTDIEKPMKPIAPPEIKTAPAINKIKLLEQTLSDAQTKFNQLSKVKGVDSSKLLKAGNDVLKYEKQLEQANAEMRKTPASARMASNSITEVGQQAQKTGSIFKSVLGGAVIGAGITKGIGAVKNSIDGAVNRFDTLNNAPKVLTSMGFAAKDAAKSSDLLKNGIDGLPTKLQEITTHAQGLSIIKGNAEAGARSALAVNNALLSSNATAEKVEQGMYAYNNAMAVGKMELDQYKTLTITMPAAMKKVSKAFGTAEGDTMGLYKKMQSGEVTMRQFDEAMIKASESTGGFSETARQATKGIGTSMKNLANTVSNNVEKTIRTINDALKAAGKGEISDYIDKIKKSVGDGFNVINSVLSKAIPKVVQSIERVVNYVQANKDWIKPLVISAGVLMGTVWSVNTLATAITLLNKEIIAMKVISTAIRDVHMLEFALNNLGKESKFAAAGLAIFNGVAKSVASFGVVGGAIKGIAVAIVGVIGVIGAIVLAVVGFVAVIALWITKTESGRKAWAKFTSFLSATGKAVWSKLGQWATSAADMTMAAWAMAAPFFKKVGSHMAAAWDGAKRSASRMAKATSSAWDNLKDKASDTGSAISQSWSNTTSALSTTFNKIGSGIGSGLGAAASAMSSAFNTMKSAISTFVGHVSNAIQTIAPYAARIINSIRTVLMFTTGGVGLALGLLTRFVTGFAKTGSVTDAIADMSDGITSGINDITNGITWFTEFLSEAIPKVTEAITAAIPKIAEAISGFAQRIADKMPEITEALTAMISKFADNIPAIAEAVSSIIANIVAVIGSLLPTLIGSGIEILLTLIEGIVSALPQIIKVGTDLLKTLLNAIIGVLPELVEAGIEILTAIMNALIDSLPLILEAGLEIVTALADGIIDALPALIEAGVQIIGALVETLATLLPAIIEAGVSLLGSIVEAVVQILPALIEAFITLVIALAQAVINNLPQIIDAFVQLILALVELFITLLPLLIDAFVKIMFALAQAIIDNLPKIIEAGAQIIMALFQAVMALLSLIIDLGIQLLVAIIQGIMQKIGELAVKGMELVGEFLGGIGSRISELIDSGVEAVTNFIDGITGWFSDLWNTGNEVAQNVLDGVSNISLADAGRAIIDGFVGGLKSAWEAGKKFIGGIGSWIKDHKGPISYDRKLLIPAGNAIMDGLNGGLSHGFGQVQDTIGHVTSTLGGINPGNSLEMGFVGALSALERLTAAMNDMDGTEVGVDSTSTTSFNSDPAFLFGSGAKSGATNTSNATNIVVERGAIQIDAANQGLNGESIARELETYLQDVESAKLSY